MTANQRNPTAAKLVYELVFFGGGIALGLAWTWQDTWTEAVCGILMVFGWLAMNGSSPLGWLLVIAICSITQERWERCLKVIRGTFGDMYDGHGGWAVGLTGYLIFLITYLVHGFMLLPFDMWTVAHETAKTVKIQPDVNITSKLQPCKLAKSLSVNAVLALLFGLAQTAHVVWSRGSQGYRIAETLPSKSEQLVCFIVGLLWNEVMFYYSHRLMHQPYWYRMVHKKHHEYTAPFALAAIYCTPVEMLVSNLWPFLAIATPMRFNVFFFGCWIGNAIMGTQTHHSGYRWPWITFFDHQPNVHDLHHQRFNCNFGNIGLLDYLHGTARDPYAFDAQQKVK